MLRRIFSFIAAICLLITSWGSVNAQSQDSKYFSETGHNIKGEFLTFYNSNPNATFLYGYPITEEFTSKDGKTVQYFQRVRFEYNSNLPVGQRTELTPLGQNTYVSTGPLNVANTFACRVFPETGIPVCFAFLEFFDQYGGTAQFGYPISGFEYHETRSYNISKKHALNGSLGKQKDNGLLSRIWAASTLTNSVKTLACLPPLSPLIIHLKLQPTYKSVHLHGKLSHWQRILS